MAENEGKGSPLGPPFGHNFRHIFHFLSAFWATLSRVDFWTGFGLDLGGFWGRFLMHFLDLLHHFFVASAHVENVVWTHYLL